MTELKVGESYIAKQVKAGKSKTGKPWEILICKHIGPRQPKIALSVANVPSGITSTGAFRLEKILCVQHKKWRSKSGQWYDGNVMVYAEITPLADFDMDDIETIGFNDVTPEFPSLEDWWSDSD